MIRVALSRFLSPRTNSCLHQTARHSINAVTITKGSYSNEQTDFIKSRTDKSVDDWTSFRSTILSKQGSINETNIDGVMLKVLINDNKIELALSYADYLKMSIDQHNLGVINGLLKLYYEVGKEKPLTEEQSQFILDTYKKLYEKYKGLDSVTCDRLLLALCTIGEWKKAFRVLDDVFTSSVPTHVAFSFLIATLFKHNKKSEALEMIGKSISNQRPLQHKAYKSWIEYILRKYKTNDTIANNLNEICMHVSKNFVTIPEKTAVLLRETYASLGWHARVARIIKQSGKCVYCKSILNCLKISEGEFKLLQKNVEEKMIVGSDVLLKTSEEELKRFLEFVKMTAPYDVVLDALNICYAAGRNKMDKIGQLTFVLEHFRQQNKKILLIGRKHMLKWPKMKYILNKTSHFFTDNESQDDPYFITAAILSGPHTDFVSKDLLRGHRFNLQDEHLRHIFQRWQWQHQWMAFSGRSGVPHLQAPLPFTPCAQNTDGNWHIPFARDDFSGHGIVKDGTPDWESWLCLQPTLPDR